MDIVSEGTQIHVRALLDPRDRTLRHIQHLGHIGLRELPGAAEFVQGHAPQFFAHTPLVIGHAGGIHQCLKFFVVPCHFFTRRTPQAIPFLSMSRAALCRQRYILGAALPPVA